MRVTPSLEFAVTWRGEVRAGIQRIWENVFDWEAPRSGESADRRDYRLTPAPRVVVDPVTGEPSLVP